MQMFQPYPVLLKIGVFEIHTFGFFVMLGIVAALLLSLRQAKKQGISRDHIINLFLWIAVGAIIGARIVYIVVHPAQFASLGDMLAIWKGGLQGAGVVLGGLAAALIYTKVKKINFFLFADLLAPYIVLAFAIGRIGCFLRGCCFGLPTELPWAITYVQNSLAGAAGLAETALHPTQLYHFLANFVIFAVLLKINKIKEKIKWIKARTRKSKLLIGGSTFLLFLILFSVQRFGIDFMRYSSTLEPQFIGLSATQLIYGAIAAVSAIIFVKKK